MKERPEHHNGPDLEILLMEQAERLRDYVDRRIPANLRSLLSADDILQDVWLAAFRGYAAFRSNGPDALDRWLTRLAQRRLLDVIRNSRTDKRGGGHRIQRAIWSRSGSMTDLFVRVSANGRSPSSEDATREAVHAMQIAMCALPEDHRRVVSLYHLEGRSREEIAVEMNRSCTAVNSLLYRALRTLREKLGPERKFFSDVGSRKTP